ncbi:hypothetical protein ATPR_3189 [Acetobacter tropicalis NBRC 101654]|uniref:Uncharacterized protein n=2 Tax=Acetobacteraceae TaxID=433 RepID=F7VIJ0_9PROT|nr:hypothetical protein ATPR_3189 [Acetobacter tropicalis NBRC 101654]
MTVLNGPGILLTERAEIVYIEVLPHDVALSDSDEETNAYEQADTAIIDQGDSDGRSRD